MSDEQRKAEIIAEAAKLHEALTWSGEFDTDQRRLHYFLGILHGIGEPVETDPVRACAVVRTIYEQIDSMVEQYLRGADDET